MKPRVLWLAGSRRRDSSNKRLARAAAVAIRDAGGEASLFDLSAYLVPLCHGDLEAEQSIPAPALALVKRVGRHHAQLIASPENNASVSALPTAD